MKKIATLLAITITFVLAGCNTMRGMGQDVQKAGSAIESAAKK
ncbi:MULTISPECIES: entericidin A/B family lipoprotein [Ramlibacter]|uniref:Type IV secretion system putative lipoprotein virB7 n=1 Tax=Ramlibacter aquaticus TaxID=2780094 RepID=A0ABR9S9P8_9BURK|nr:MULTISPECIES: entericidin A/B family lipoprotein [Ramlibacter]MBE7939060.1 entericidin A/B family lipoprotein [Ramlibacter aquaticus]